MRWFPLFIPLHLDVHYIVLLDLLLTIKMVSPLYTVVSRCTINFTVITQPHYKDGFSLLIPIDIDIHYTVLLALVLTIKIVSLLLPLHLDIHYTVLLALLVNVKMVSLLITLHPNVHWPLHCTVSIAPRYIRTFYLLILLHYKVCFWYNAILIFTVNQALHNTHPFPYVLIFANITKLSPP